MGAPTLVVLRAFALARSLFEPITLRRALAKAVLAFVRERGSAYPREVDPTSRTARSRTTGAALLARRAICSTRRAR
jgi:hypothetical protein